MIIFDHVFIATVLVWFVRLVVRASSQGRYPYPPRILFRRGRRGGIFRPRASTYRDRLPGRF